MPKFSSLWCTWHLMLLNAAPSSFRSMSWLLLEAQHWLANQKHFSSVGNEHQGALNISFCINSLQGCGYWVFNPLSRMPSFCPPRYGLQMAGASEDSCCLLYFDLLIYSIKVNTWTGVPNYQVLKNTETMNFKKTQHSIFMFILKPSHFFLLQTVGIKIKQAHGMYIKANFLPRKRKERLIYYFIHV